MQDLGQSFDKLYPTNTGKDTKSYPSVRVPIEMLGKKTSPGDKHTLSFKAEIVHADKTHASLDLTHGESSESAKEEKGESDKEESKEDTILGGK